MLNVIQHRNPSGIFRATSKSTEEWKYTKKGRENGTRVNMSDLNQANAENVDWLFLQVKYEM